MDDFDDVIAELAKFDEDIKKEQEEQVKKATIESVLLLKHSKIKDRNLTEDMTHANTAAYHWKERETIIQESSKTVVKIVPRSLSELRRKLWKADQTLDWDKFKQLLYYNECFTYDEVVTAFVYSKIAADCVTKDNLRVQDCSTLFSPWIWKHLCNPEHWSIQCKKEHNNGKRIWLMRDLFIREAEFMSVWNAFELIGVQLLIVLHDNAPVDVSILRDCPRDWYHQFFIDVLLKFRTIKMEFSKIWPVRTCADFLCGVIFDPDLSPEYLKFFKVIAKNLTSSRILDRESSITTIEQFRQQVREMINYEMQILADVAKRYSDQPYKDAEFADLTRKRLYLASFRNEVEVYFGHFQGEHNVRLTDLENKFLPQYDKIVAAILKGDYARINSLKLI
jgi:hypothetical protein